MYKVTLELPNLEEVTFLLGTLTSGTSLISVKKTKSPSLIWNSGTSVNVPANYPYTFTNENS